MSKPPSFTTSILALKKLITGCLLLFCLATSKVISGQCALTLVVNSNNATCPCNNGRATVSVSGGATPYTYVWTNSISPGAVSILPLKDNSIYEQFMSNSNGAGEFLTAGVSATGFKHRALLAFFIDGSIPAGASIINASLTLNVNLTSGLNGPNMHYLHKVEQNWGEGISNAGGHPGQGADAEINDATWLKNFYPNSDWANTGGTFNPVSSASTLVDQPGFYTWSSSSMITDVQGWFDAPSANFGWLVKSDEAGIRQAKRYCSKENGTLENRPVLTINYGPRIISTASFVSNLAPGFYNITVTDANGCTANGTVTISKD